MVKTDNFNTYDMNNKEKRISLEEIMGMERFYRQAFINTISGFKSANLIGTINNEGVTNLAIFNSVIHIGANPPYLGLILRPASVERHTYDNIKTTRHYSINHVHHDFVKEAHQTSAKYPADVSEFEACGFTPMYSNTLRTPYVQESSVKIGMEFLEEYPIQLNGTILIIGKIMEIILSESVLLESGHINLDDAGSVAVGGLDTYYSTELLSRLSYARPGEELKNI